MPSLLLFAFFGVELRQDRVGDCKAGNLVVIGFALEPVDVELEGADATVEAHHTGPLVRGRVATSLDLGAEVLSLFRNAVVDQVHHAARRRRAVEQGGRAAQNLDAVDQQRLGRNCVVRAQGRGIQ